jgi:glycerophosphoryl diester phosphodiesterase
MLQSLTHYKPLPSCRKKLFFKALIIFIFIIVTIIWYFSVIHKFNSLKPRTLKNLPSRTIWAHRGFTQGYTENSLDSFDAARRLGYYGIELDIHYLDGKGIVVAHDIQKNNSITQNYLFLETVFSRYKYDFYYWLDFKNLSDSNAQISAELLLKHIDLYKLTGHVFVESTKLSALRRLKEIAPDIYTIYWLPGNLHIKPVLFFTKYQLLHSDIDIVSIPEKYVSDILFDNFSHLNLAIYTVNNPERVDYYFRKGTRIILSDVNMRPIFPEAYRDNNQ